ncbi:MAG TPA: 2-phosphosulfolactate phosphatase [Ilumatobacteraceae bacterium]
MTSGARDTSVVAQDGYAFRFDWGLDGLRALAPVADVVVIVDILRFTSAVCAAIESGATVLPYPFDRAGAVVYAAERGAVAAGERELGGPSLSPTDLLTVARGARIVLPSPNGATLSFAARELGARRVFAGSLRNAAATARAVRDVVANGGVVAAIAAGERWSVTDGSLRPAVEDFIGAGAVLTALDPSGAVAAPCCSPEARAARAAFLDARPNLHHFLSGSASGRELIGRGWEDDVATSAALDVAVVAAELIGDEFVAV